MFQVVHIYRDFSILFDLSCVMNLNVTNAKDLNVFSVQEDFL